MPLQDELAGVEDVLAGELAVGTEAIDRIMRYAAQNGGKRIRPILCLLAGRVVRASEMVRLAAAVEMIHTASLLHDDVVDDALIRRGQASVKARWGNKTSVLVGNLLLTKASKIFIGRNDRRLLTAVTDAIAATTDGELLEIFHQNNLEISAETYMRIIRGKTAALFSFAGRIPAIIAGAEKRCETALGEFGLNLGHAFQLADDALDYVADEKRFGKNAGTDLREGKLTYPLIAALSGANADERRTIQNALVARRFSPEQFLAVSEIIGRHGGIEATWKMAREYAQRAKGTLSVFEPSVERDSLIMLADYAVERGE